MAANGVSAQEALAPILTAVDTMQSSTDKVQKQSAADYLDQFQKTSDAWNTCIAILQTSNLSPQMKMFAATALKGQDAMKRPRFLEAQLTPSKAKSSSIFISFRRIPSHSCEIQYSRSLLPTRKEA
jgi:transportin-3